MVKNGNGQRMKQDVPDGRGERDERPKLPQRPRLTIVRRGNRPGDMGDWVIDEVE